MKLIAKHLISEAPADTQVLLSAKWIGKNRWLGLYQESDGTWDVRGYSDERCLWGDLCGHQFSDQRAAISFYDSYPVTYDLPISTY